MKVIFYLFNLISTNQLESFLKIKEVDQKTSDSDQTNLLNQLCYHLKLSTIFLEEIDSFLRSKSKKNIQDDLIKDSDDLGSLFNNDDSEIVKASFEEFVPEDEVIKKNFFKLANLC